MAWFHIFKHFIRIPAVDFVRYCPLEMIAFRFWYHFKKCLGLCAYFVFSGLFITESLASAVTTTDSTGTDSTVENKNVSVNGPDTTLYDSATQEILTTHQFLTAGNGSEPETFEFFSEIEQLMELKVGMRLNVTLVAVYPNGLYNLTGISLYDDTSDKNFDVVDVTCIVGRGVQYSIYYHQSNYVDKESNFYRSTEYGEFRKDVNVTGFDKEDQAIKCTFLVYLHNSAGLSDKQNISLLATLVVYSPKESLYFEKPVTFLARTFVMNPNNKSAMYEIDSSFLPVLLGNRNELKKIIFRCWIPYYNPHIKILMRSDMSTTYLRLKSFGENFTPGAQIKRLPKVARFEQPDQNDLELTFPTHWVNRGYPYTEKTSDADLLEFEAGVVMSASLTTCVNYSIGIEVLLHNTQVWNSSAIISACNFSDSESLNNTFNIKIQAVESSKSEIFPNSKSELFLKMTLSKQGLSVINITISSEAHRDLRKPSLSIEQLSVYNVSTDIIYESPNVSYYNKGSSFPVEAFWTLYLFNLNDDEIGTVYLFLKYKLHSTTVTIGETYSFTVVYDDRVLEYQVPTNKPIIYQDKDLCLMSEIHTLFDGNFTTCVGLPVQGESPPWFWMRLNTTWLNISSSTFGVTVVGNQISCQQNGRTLLQIAYPLESPIFEHRMEFCILTNITSSRRVVECDYLCQCSKGNDCQELILFMANQEKMASWSLCEISARNVA